MIADPHAVAARWPDPRLRAIAATALAVTETPWAVPASSELSTAERIHVIALSAFFGHLNRIADAVAVPLDYQVLHVPPHAEPATPARAPAPHLVDGDDAGLAQRPATAAALAAWQEHVRTKVGRLEPAQRAMIAARVGQRLGARRSGPRPTSAIDHALGALADQVTLAPWQLGDASYEPLRAAGFSDADVFDAVVVASTAGLEAQLELALRSVD